MAGACLRKTVTAWVERVFKDKNFNKVEVEFPNYDSSGGYVADMVFATAIVERNESEEKYDLVIKKGKDNIVQGKFSHIAQVYTNEVNFYSRFLPYFQKFAKDRNASPFDNIPYCYGTIAEDNQSVIILENLKLKGFSMHDLKTTMDMNHINLVIDAYAKWHAFSFALRDQQPKVFEKFGEINIEVDEPKILDNLIENAEKELDFLIEMYKKKNKLHFIEKLESTKAKSRNIMETFMDIKNEDYLVIRHGDCWNNNFLFHYEDGKSTPDKVVVVDWQLALLGSPLSDVTQFLFSCCSKTELEHLDDILQHYYNSLSKTLSELGSDPEKCFPWKICLKSFRKYAVFPIMEMPVLVRLSCRVETDEKFDISDLAGENSRVIFNSKLRDPEEYFNRIDGILELCIERDLV